MNKRRRGIGWIAIVLALLLGVAAAFLAVRYQSFADAPIAPFAPDASLVVERGDGFNAVLRKLRSAGAPAGRDLEWQALARQMGVAGRLQAGEYALSPRTTPRTLLQDMRDGKVVSHRFTIVEGLNIRELRAALAAATPQAHRIDALDDAALMARLGFPGQHPEGRFLPETYAYTKGDSDLDLLKRAHADRDKVLDAAWQARTPGLPLKSKDEALVLASIVEKETGVAEERARIAGVFVRRLGIGMRLQTDPTVIYGMGAAYKGNIRRSDLLADTPYNTYTRAGLPPTPIAMPGKEALQAATRPAADDALYFVAVGDGSGRHVFTRTLAEHQSAVQDYLQRYRARNGSDAAPADALPPVAPATATPPAASPAPAPARTP